MKKLMVSLVLLLLTIAAGCNNQNKYPLSKNATSINNVEATTIIEDLSSYFKGYDACFLLYDQNKNTYTIYNEAKSQKPVSPCSTFKIINSLIGLETKVLEDENTLIKWNGIHYSNDEWNKDQTLTSAVQKSAFWYFQQVATNVGSDRMQAYLKDINYGNSDISGGIDQFWQQSTLKISPKNQIELLQQVYTYQAPFSKRNIDIVKEILVLSEKNGVIISGKTGSGLQSGKFIKELEDEYVNGWFVGYMEKDNNVYYFTTNLEAAKNATGSVAKEITLEILKDKGYR
ncbi:MAG: Beta-lactamase [Clostridiales bacterium]|jgi:bla regulator protein BlaR1|nr:Beta-lactamase [Clostridiales bacterium]